jgi:hypothetical protein
MERIMQIEWPLRGPAIVPCGSTTVRREPTSASSLCNWHGTVVGHEAPFDFMAEIVNNRFSPSRKRDRRR